MHKNSHKEFSFNLRCQHQKRLSWQPLMYLFFRFYTSCHGVLINDEVMTIKNKYISTDSGFMCEAVARVQLSVQPITRQQWLELNRCCVDFCTVSQFLSESSHCELYTHLLCLTPNTVGVDSPTRLTNTTDSFRLKPDRNSTLYLTRLGRTLRCGLFASSTWN